MWPQWPPLTGYVVFVRKVLMIAQIQPRLYCNQLIFYSEYERNYKHPFRLLQVLVDEEKEVLVQNNMDLAAELPNN